MIDKKILFVHIPKTGGTSVATALNDHQKRAFPSAAIKDDLKNHHPLLSHERMNKLSDFFVISIVRNPFTRAYSYFNQYKRRNNFTGSFEKFLNFIKDNSSTITNLYISQKPLIYPYIIDDVIQTKDITVNNHEFHKDKNPQRYSYKDEKLPRPDTTPFIFFTQCFYLRNKLGNIAVDKIYKLENLKELEDDIGIIVPNLNVGLYNKDNYYTEYNQTNIDLVRHIYLEDFENLGYSTNFV